MSSHSLVWRVAGDFCHFNASEFTYKNTCKSFIIAPQHVFSVPLVRKVVIIMHGKFWKGSKNTRIRWTLIVFSLNQLVTQSFRWVISHRMMWLFWICKRLSSLYLYYEMRISEWHTFSPNKMILKPSLHTQRNLYFFVYVLQEPVGGVGGAK